MPIYKYYTAQGCLAQGFTVYSFIIGICSMVTVNLKNIVSVHKKKEFAGDYQISETVNGKPSWKSGENAIWFLPVQNNWMIGYWNKLGEDDGQIHASNDYGGLSDIHNIWKYTVDDGPWITPSSSNDVIITCSTGKNLQNIFGQHLLG